MDLGKGSWIRQECCTILIPRRKKVVTLVPFFVENKGAMTSQVLNFKFNFRTDKAISSKKHNMN